VTAEVTGEPLSGLQVVALPPDAETVNVIDPTDPIKETTTGSDGRYEVHGLAAGDYRLEVRRTLTPRLETAAPGGIFRAVQLSNQRDGFAVAAEASIAVPPDPIVMTEMDLNAQLLSNSEIHGRILVDDGIAGAAMRLSLSRRGGPSFLSEDGILVGNEYRITGLAPGTYSLSAHIVSDVPEQRLGRIAEIVLGSGPLEQDLVLSEGATINGRVVVEDGDIGDDWELDLVSRRLNASVVFRGNRRRLSAEVPTFSIAHVLEGRYGIGIRNAFGFQVTRLRLDGQSIDGSEFELTPGPVEHSLEVFLEPND
jgi:hypothetical protein